MNDMIMQVARAISDADMTCNGDYRKLARAAIEAMREPTEAMIDAATFEPGAANYSLMIDAALLQQEPKPDIAEGIPSIDDPH